MRHQLMNLRQSGRSVEEYASEFTRLSQYALVLVAREVDQARAFIDGLKDELRHIVSTMEFAN